MEGLLGRFRPQLVLIVLSLALCAAAFWRPGKASADLLQQLQGLVIPASTKPVSKSDIIPKPKPADCSKVKCIALTFDDGPDSITTPQILSTLEAYHVNATFFVVGNRAISMPCLLQRMHRDGDEIGNHSWSHPDVAKLNAAQVNYQIVKTQQAVIAAGIPAPAIFRPPYAGISTIMRDKIPMPFIMWNDDTRDWANRNSRQTRQLALSEASAGGIIEMHDIYQSTAEALPNIIKDLKPTYHIVTVSQLLGINASSRGVYYAR